MGSLRKFAVVFSKAEYKGRSPELERIRKRTVARFDRDATRRAWLLVVLDFVCSLLIHYDLSCI